MTDLPDIKLRALPNFPVRVEGDGGIEVVKENGVYTVRPTAGVIGDVFGPGADADPIDVIGKVAVFADANHIVPIEGGAVSFDDIAPTTTRGDLIYRNAATNTRLPAGTAGYHLQTNGTGADPSWAGFLQAGTGAATRTWQNKARDFVSALDFGATGDGTTDDTAAIQLALDTGKRIYFPAGTYKVTSQLDITLSGTCVIGAGRAQTIFMSSITGKSFSVDSGLSYIEFRDFSLTRASGGGTSGNNGIHFDGITERAFLNNLEVTEHYINFRFCTTSYSKAQDIFSDNSRSHGIYITNEDAVAAGLQWEMVRPFAQRADGWGIRYFSNFGTSAVVGPLLAPWLYANKLGGIAFQGTSTKPLNGIRIIGGFSGEEGGDSLYIDTYGTVDSQVDSFQTEINGTGPVGVNQGTSAPHVGRGIVVTANNTAAKITGCIALGHSGSGIVSECPRIVIAGCTVRGNGAASLSGDQTGIYIVGGRAVIVGNSSLGQSTATGFGIYLQNDGGHTVVGNDVSESNTTPIGAATTLTNSILENNYGSTYEQAPTAPTPTAGSGSFSDASATLKYMKNGKRVDFTSTVVITTNGTAAGYVAIPLPFTAEARAVCCAAFDETALLGLIGYIPASSTSVRIYTPAGAYPGATGKTLMVAGHYWVA